MAMLSIPTSWRHDAITIDMVVYDVTAPHVLSRYKHYAQLPFRCNQLDTILRKRCELNSCFSGQNIHRTGVQVATLFSTNVSIL